MSFFPTSNFKRSFNIYHKQIQFFFQIITIVVTVIWKITKQFEQILGGSLPNSHLLLGYLLILHEKEGAQSIGATSAYFYRNFR